MFLTTITPRSTRENQAYVTILTMPFERIAERLAELLCTNIWVLDEQQVLLASRLPLALGRDLDLNDHAAVGAQSANSRVTTSRAGYRISRAQAG